MFALRMAVTIPLAIAASRLQAENFIKVEIDGKSVVLDTDSSSVQRNLKPANPQAGAVKLPAWLYPSPGHAPLRSNYDANTGFASGGTVDQVVAYYGQLLASKAYTTGPPLGSATSKIVSGKGALASVSVIASPARALLCLRDAVTGEEYYLDAPGIMAANLKWPGGVQSEGAPYPSWFPIYPGAQRATAKIVLLMDPTVTFQTRDSIRAVYDFYRTALEGAGAKLLNQNLSRSGNPVKDFSAEIAAQKGDDVVEVMIKELHDPNPARVMNGEKPLEGTAIGVLYRVPKRQGVLDETAP